MKEYRGEITRIMAEMPAELVEVLHAAHPQHDITGREVHWWAT